MRQMLNVLFVTTQGTYLSKDRETVAIHVDKELKMRLPIHNFQGIVCFGRVTCSPFLLGHCGENGVAVSFCTENGRFLARVSGPVSGNVLLRKEQYRRSDNPEASLAIARPIVAAKISNSGQVISRAVRDHGETGDVARLDHMRKQLKAYLGKLNFISSLDELRGIEGRTAADYFDIFDLLILQSKNEFQFANRNRRPPLDPVNAMLSFVYSLIHHDTRSALESVGLDPAVGFLHRDRPGRYGLALDLMEEFRAYIGDRLVLTLINQKQVRPSGFKMSESGAVEMNDDTRKTLLKAYQEKKKTEIVHPFLKEKISAGMLYYAQALLLARFLRGDLDGYPPFIWR
jgi:CRISPR-associated protein Cas1